MKFAEYLSTHLTPEWRKQYIHYNKMKDMLYDALEEFEAESVDEENPNPADSRAYERFEKIWFQFSNDELHKINTFFKEQLVDAKVKCDRLHSDLEKLRREEECCRKTSHNHYYSSNNDNDGNYVKVRLSKSQPTRRRTTGTERARKVSKISRNKMQDLKLAFSEYYLSLVLIQNYQKINFTGFRKIQKKHDKLLQTGSGAKWMKEFAEPAEFHTNKENDKLIERTEDTVINQLEGGDRPKAMKSLRVTPRDMSQNPWVTFKVGLFAGILAVLLAIIIITAIFDLNDGKKDYRLVFRLYRGSFLFIVFLFLLSINIYGWRRSGVNHVLIFELDPRNHLRELHLLQLAAFLGILWALSLLAFLYANELGIPAYTSPLALFVLLVGIFLNPTKTYHHHARFWLMRVLGRILCAPFFYVGFADFWLADQLNSLSQVLVDTQYTICFFATSKGEFYYHEDGDTERCTSNTWLIRAFITLIPAWCRFMQCLRRYRDTREAFPHLVNAGKYSTTFFVITFSTLYSRTESAQTDGAVYFNVFFLFWILAAVTSSIYAYIWDMKMDWGLFDKEAGKNRFLRKEIVFPKAAYYFGIVEDLFLRFGWVLMYSLTELNFIHKDILIMVLTPLELFRRFVWNFFRLENEHLNNCGKFRAVRDITIASLHASHHHHGSWHKNERIKQAFGAAMAAATNPLRVDVQPIQTIT